MMQRPGFARTGRNKANGRRSTLLKQNQTRNLYIVAVKERIDSDTGVKSKSDVSHDSLTTMIQSLLPFTSS